MRGPRPVSIRIAPSIRWTAPTLRGRRPASCGRAPHLCFSAIARRTPRRRGFPASRPPGGDAHAGGEPQAEEKRIARGFLLTDLGAPSRRREMQSIWWALSLAPHATDIVGDPRHIGVTDTRPVTVSAGTHAEIGLIHPIGEVVAAGKRGESIGGGRAGRPIRDLVLGEPSPTQTIP